MATMSQTWTIFTALTVLAVQLCLGEKSCSIWSSAGPVVQRGSGFNVSCRFYCKCKGAMFSDHPPTQQNYIEHNSSTIYFNVLNITKNRTFSCRCECRPPLDPCGMDIQAGYLPERPKNISCIYKVTSNKGGVVLCTWNRGRETYLRNSSVLCVRTVPGNYTEVSSKGTASPSASFSVSSSVQLISVWVRAQNPLGSAVSATVNYTLSDIAIPPTPVLGQPVCFSRECTIKVEQPVRIQHLEIQYRAETQTWTSCPDSGVQNSSVQVSSLEPYRLYHFRARSNFSRGLWSQWSTNVSSWTQEEAPARELDVWYASDLKSLRVYWKEAKTSIARGKISQYKVRVYSPNSKLVSSHNISADERNYSVPFCANCEVTVLACNSKGMSPPARITTHHTKANPPQDVQVTVDNQTVAISWRKPETAPLPAAFVVEWYPQGHKLKELRWVRLGGNDNHAVITGMKPFECYEGAVYVVYNENSISRTGFTGVTTSKSVPAAGPSFEEAVEGNKVTVTWTEIPRSQRGGCITKYTIYLENGNGQREIYPVPASERMYIIKELPPALYRVWMTASTDQGESRASRELKFFIQPETQLSLVLVCIVVSMTVMFLVCLYQSSAVKQRFYMFFQCLMLEVPDPKNSKWAKECTKEKGKMKLQLQLSNSSVNEWEEEPILVDVEELPKQSSDTRTPTDVSSQLPLPTSLSPLTEPVTLLYPQTTYIKSFSHDSDSSDHTQTSLDTNTTGDYISSHGPGTMDEEDEDKEEDEQDNEEFVGMGFFPSPNIFIDSLQIGGKLTLDAVRIDCNNFFQSS